MTETTTAVNIFAPMTQFSGIPSKCYDLKTMGSISFDDLLNRNIDSIFTNRPLTILFEVDGAQYSEDVLGKGAALFTENGYTLTYSLNELEDTALFKAIRNDVYAFGLQEIATTDFETFNSNESKTFLTDRNDYFNNLVGKEIKKLFCNDSPFSQEEELDILDQFFN